MSQQLCKHFTKEWIDSVFPPDPKIGVKKWNAEKGEIGEETLRGIISSFDYVEDLRRLQFRSRNPDLYVRTNAPAEYTIEMKHIYNYFSSRWGTEDGLRHFDTDWVAENVIDKRWQAPQYPLFKAPVNTVWDPVEQKTVRVYDDRAHVFPIMPMMRIRKVFVTSTLEQTISNEAKTALEAVGIRPIYAGHIFLHPKQILDGEDGFCNGRTIARITKMLDRMFLNDGAKE